MTTLRDSLEPNDVARIKALVQATGFFSEEEIEIAAELATERCEKGEKSGYHFVLADSQNALSGYACYGPIAGTRASYDLYWIAVAPSRQGNGIGSILLKAVEDGIRAKGGERIYIDTSTRAQYQPTRTFYKKCGYEEAAHLSDFYAPGDGKVIFLRTL